METSLFLAKVLGLYLVVIGFWSISRRHTLGEIVADLDRSPALMLLMGILSLLLGLLMVLSHNVWVLDWRVIITAVGWLALLQGVVRMLIPERALAVGQQVRPPVLVGLGVVSLLLGVFVAYRGFSA